MKSIAFLLLLHKHALLLLLLVTPAAPINTTMATTTTTKATTTNNNNSNNNNNNVSDYQLHDKFPPDKTPTWSYGIHHDGWMLAHHGLRGELQDFEDALESMIRLLSSSSSSIEDANNNNNKVQALQTWWRGHLKHMISHHRNEDATAKKFAEQRFQWPAFVEADHEEIAQLIDAIATLVHTITTTTTSSPNSKILLPLLSDLKNRWQEYHRVVAHHLDQEEDVCIGLMRAYFTQNQVQSMQHRLAIMGPRVEMGAIAHYVGFDQLEESARQQKTPQVLQWIGTNLILKPRYRFYLKTMVKQLELMKSTF